MPRATVRVLAAATLAVALAGCANEGTSPQPETPAPPPAPVSSPAAPPPAGASTPPSQEPAAVSKEEAGRIATDKYGGQVIDIESDTAQGQPSWEVEIRDSSQGRIEVDVSQSTGEIVEMEQD